MDEKLDYNILLKKLLKLDTEIISISDSIQHLDEKTQKAINNIYEAFLDAEEVVAKLAEDKF